MSSRQDNALTRTLIDDISTKRTDVLGPLRAARNLLAHQPAPTASLGDDVQRSSADAHDTSAPDPQRAFILGVVQPGLAGLMDGSISSLAPSSPPPSPHATVGPPSSSASLPPSAPGSACPSPKGSPTTAR